jgi:hypothetical protein
MTCSRYKGKPHRAHVTTGQVTILTCFGDANDPFGMLGLLVVHLQCSYHSAGAQVTKPLLCAHFMKIVHLNSVKGWHGRMPLVGYSMAL